MASKRNGYQAGNIDGYQKMKETTAGSPTCKQAAYDSNRRPTLCRQFFFFRELLRTGGSVMVLDLTGMLAGLFGLTFPMGMPF